jgi:hypothetical protein
MDREVGIASQVANDVIEGAACECHDRSAFRADEMVAVSWLADDIRRMTAGLEQSCQNVDRSKNFERSIDRGSTNLRHLGDKLLSGKWALAIKNRSYNPAAWRRHSVPMFQEECIDVRRPK